MVCITPAFLLPPPEQVSNDTKSLVRQEVFLLGAYVVSSGSSSISYLHALNICLPTQKIFFFFLIKGKITKFLKTLRKLLIYRDIGKLL